MNRIARLRRRKVIRMTGLWLAGACLLTEIAGTMPIFGAPDGVARTVVIMLAIGRAPTLLVSWAFEPTSERRKRDNAAPAADSISAQIARRMDRVLPVMMAPALGYRRPPL